MPLEVVDARAESGVPEVFRRHRDWSRPELARDIATVRRVVDDIRERGDEALIHYSRVVYGAELSPATLPVSVADRDKAAGRVERKVREALEAAATNIRAFHEAQRPQDWSLDREGATVGQVFRPIRRVGIHAPAGGFPLPSSLLMTVVPALVAGVDEIALCCPADTTGAPPDVMLAAAEVCEVEEIYRIGGAHAIAALAFGTDTIRPCDKVAGPGGLYTTLAKREVFGSVGIDGLFGPSESVVVADDRARPAYAAAELLTQAEHDPEAAAVLVTTSEEVLSACLKEVEAQLQSLPNVADIREALANHGLAVLVRDFDQAAQIVNELAPEHVCLQVEDPPALLSKLRAAGAVMMGDDTPATVSDYCAGPSHVLPTARTARYQSGLGVRDFLVAMNTVEYSRQALFREAPIADALASAEGLQAHREGLHARLEER
ncbi:MAG: histidinol dehydrogenase [Actinomycetota bacterium]